MVVLGGADMRKIFSFSLCCNKEVLPMQMEQHRFDKCSALLSSLDSGAGHFASLVSGATALSLILTHILASLCYQALK